MSTKNVFPINTLPECVRVFITQLAERQSMVPDFLATTFLAVASACCGGKVIVRVSSTYTENPILWLPLVGNSASKKSAAMKLMLKPLDELDTEFDELHRLKVDEWKKKSDTDSRGSFPKSRQTKVDDLTMEALADIVDHNHSGLLMAKDELMSWIKESSRYSGGAGKGEEERWLGLHDGRSIRINRKNSENSKFVRDPFVSVAGGIQPGVLSSLFTSDRVNNGFINRLLFCYPDPEDQFVSEREVDSQVISTYSEFVKMLWNKEVTRKESGAFIPVELPLSKEARQLYHNWRNDFSLPIINDRNRDNHNKDYISKLEAGVLRIAGILEYVWSGTNMPLVIRWENMERSLQLGHYFYQNWLKVREVVANPKDNDGPAKLHLDLVIDALNDQELHLRTLAHNLYKKGVTNNKIAGILKVAKSTVSKWLNEL